MRVPVPIVAERRTLCCDARLQGRFVVLNRSEVLELRAGQVCGAPGFEDLPGAVLVQRAAQLGAQHVDGARLARCALRQGGHDGAARYGNGVQER